MSSVKKVPESTLVIKLNKLLPDLLPHPEKFMKIQK